MLGVKAHKIIHQTVTLVCCVCIYFAIVLNSHYRFASWVPIVSVPLVGLSWLVLSLRVRGLKKRAEQADYRNCPFCDYETVVKEDGHLCPECGAAFRQGELRRTWINKVRWLLGEPIPIDQWRTAIPPKTIEWKAPRQLPKWTSMLTLEQVGRRSVWTFVGAVAVTVLIVLANLPRLLIAIAFIPWIVYAWQWYQHRSVLRERIFEHGDLICPHCMHPLAKQQDHLRCFECGFHCEPKELQPLWAMKLQGNTPDPSTNVEG